MSEWAGALDQALMRGREELIGARAITTSASLDHFVNAAVRGDDGEGGGGRRRRRARL